MLEEARELIRELSRPAIVRGVFSVSWIIIGAGAVWLGLPITWPLEQRHVWLVLASMCLATAVAYQLRAPWLRWVAVPVGLALALLFGVISLFAFYPLILYWWLGVLLALFGVWTVLVGMAGFKRRPDDQRAD